MKLTKIESEVMLMAIRVIEAKDIGDLMEEFKGLTEGEHATMVTRNVGLRHVKVIKIYLFLLKVIAF